jgi:hypothetical protein
MVFMESVFPSTTLFSFSLAELKTNKAPLKKMFISNLSLPVFLPNAFDVAQKLRTEYKSVNIFSCFFASHKSTIKLVYNDHPWVPKIVAAVVDKWSLFRGSLNVETGWDSKIVVFVDRWSLAQV